MHCSSTAYGPAVAPPTALRGRRAPLRVRAVAAEQQPATRLTKDDLVAYLASGCKPRDKWR